MKGLGSTRWCPPLPLLISVLVTEIQRRRVGGAKEPFKTTPWTEPSRGADAPWLEFCDRHRNEGWETNRVSRIRA